jgi:hypothetical protein
MRHLHRLLGTLVVIASVSSAEVRVRAQDPQPVAIPMELMSGRPVIRVTVNGQGPYAFLIAPEDQATQIDRELADALKFKELVKEAEKATEKAEKAAKDLVKEAEKAAAKAEKAKDGRARATPVANGAPQATNGAPHAANGTPQAANGALQATVLLQFAGAKNLAGITVPVTVGDVARALPEFDSTVRPRGIVSLSLWKDQLVTFDYSRWMLLLQPGTLPEPNGKEVFPLTPDRQLRLPLAIADQSIDCHVDPLFPEGLLLPPAYASVIPVDGKPRDWGVVTTREGPVRVREAKLAANLMLGPFEMRHPLVMLADTGDTPTVGTRWLGRFAVTYDLANGRARLDRITLPSSGR